MSAIFTSLYDGVLTALQGGNLGDIILSMTENFATAAIWKGTGSFLGKFATGAGFKAVAERTLVHGLVGGGIASVEGGSFKDGFIAAAAGEAVCGNVSSEELEAHTMEYVAERILGAAVVGGTMSVIMGGSFANGAKTAAYAELYNSISDIGRVQYLKVQAYYQEGSFIASHPQLALQLAIMVTAPLGVGEVLEGGEVVVDSFGPMSEGPLSEDIANTFRSGTYTGKTLGEPTTFWRTIGDGGNPEGRFWIAMKPQGPLQSVIDSALDQNWGNTATQVVEREFSAGTRIYEGAAAARRGLVGGGSQIYIP